MVLGSGFVLGLLGAVLIFRLPLALALKAVLALLWVAHSVLELQRLVRAYRHTDSYRLLADGSIDVLSTDGRCRAAQFAAGSVVLPRLAWLRIRTIDGDGWGELVCGDARKSQQWRRFQVICRHVGAC